MKFEPIVKTYYDALEEGKILAKRCKHCGKITYPPVPVCQECSKTDLEWTELSTEAELIHVGPIADHFIWEKMKAYAPVGWGEVRIPDGPDLSVVVVGVANYEEANKRLPLKVQAEIIQDNGFKTVVYRIVE